MVSNNEISYAPLEAEFTRKGCSFKMLDRVGEVCIYERRDADFVCWEVIRVSYDKGGEKMMGGVKVVFEPKERYPSDEEFGVRGWCYTGYDRAKIKFDALVASREDSQNAIRADA